MRGSLFLCSPAQSNESTGSELFDLGVVVAKDALEDIVRILAESGVPSRIIRKKVCRHRLNEVSRQ